ncbi:MAG: hypothetical protein RBQ81_07730 [Arcobacteraceae bacterium]|nr:hypothetical protein [Arcobacteraceae bacterium]MDY0365734.1 hypothetical protein [Arcobacteraceae bacterium]
MAYSLEVDELLEAEMTSYLKKDVNLTIQELLAAYAQKSQECVVLKEGIKLISEKLPKI